MEISWKWLNLCLGLLFFQLCNGFPINLEDSVADQHTQLLTGLVAVLLTICSVVLLAGCLCCQRRNGFKEFRDSPVVASAASNLDHGHVNPIANGEFTIFTPLSPPYNNNVFLANERIVTRTAEDFAHEDFDVTAWFNESERDFPRTKLKYIKELGRGWFGKVVEGAAKEVPPNEQAWTPVVVRILDATASRKERVLFLNDAAIYRCGTHVNILNLIGRCLDTVPLLLLQEYGPQGDLKKYLRSKKENVEQLLSTDYPLLWCCQLTSALKHLHNNGVAHPDLATRNCQLASDLALKVGDYGLAESRYPDDYYQGTPRVPVRWCAPESLTCTLTTIQPKKPTTESNIWSLGVTMWEICECGAQPYGTFSDDEVVSQVLGPPNVRLSRPSFPVLYTDYLFRLMQLCWTNAESRPTVSQIDLMLSDLWQVYKNTRDSNLSADDFEKRWTSFKPNSIVRNDVLADNAEMEESGANIAKPLSPSLNNLHGSLDNLLDPGDQMELWLENVTKSDDLSFAKSDFNANPNLDDPLVSEISSSDSSDRVSPKQKKSKLKSKIDFDSNTKFRDSIFKQPYNFSDSALFSQRTSSESETEDENWRKKVERGAYTEKVRLKSRSVADLMILTHVDYSESESETPVPSLDYRVNYKNVRYAPKNNLENVSLTYGSEGNLLSVHDTFQEELKKLKEERRDSLLFVPDNHSHNNFSRLDNNNYDFPLEELTLSDSNLNNINMIDSTNGKRLMRELNRVAEIQPANQVFNVFSVTIDKFKPIRVNSCKLNDIINFSDVETCFTPERKDGCEVPFERQSVEESLSPTNDNQNVGNSVDLCDINDKHISDLITETYPSALDGAFQSLTDDAYFHRLSNEDISNSKIYSRTDVRQSNNDGIYQDIEPNNVAVGNKEIDLEENTITDRSIERLSLQNAEDRNIVETINPIFINMEIINGLETELSSNNLNNKTFQPSHTNRNSIEDTKIDIDVKDGNEILDNKLRITPLDSFGSKENLISVKNDVTSESDEQQNIVEAINLIVSTNAVDLDLERSSVVADVRSDSLIDSETLKDESELANLNENLDTPNLVHTRNLDFECDDVFEAAEITKEKNSDFETDREVCKLKLGEDNQDENIDNVKSCGSITEISVEETNGRFQVQKLSDIIKNQNVVFNNTDNPSISDVQPFNKDSVVETCEPQLQLGENEKSIPGSLKHLREPDLLNNASVKNIASEGETDLANSNINYTSGNDNFLQLERFENESSTDNASETIFNTENENTIPERRIRSGALILSEIVRFDIKENQKFLYEEINNSQVSNLSEFAVQNDDTNSLEKTFTQMDKSVPEKEIIQNVNISNETPIECDRIQNKDAVDLNDIPLINVSEGHEADSTFQAAEESEQQSMCDRGDNNDLRDLSKTIETSNDRNCENNSLKKLNNFHLDSNLENFTEIKSNADKTNGNVVAITEKSGSEPHEKCQTTNTIDVNDIILVDINELGNNLQFERKIFGNNLNGTHTNLQKTSLQNSQNTSRVNGLPDSKLEEKLELQALQHNAVEINSFDHQADFHGICPVNKKNSSHDNHVVDLSDIIVEINDLPDITNNFRVPKLSHIILNKHRTDDNKPCHTDNPDILLKEKNFSDTSCKFAIPKLSEIIQNKYIVSKHCDGDSDKGRLNCDEEGKFIDRNESHALCDRKHIESEDTGDTECSECNKNDDNQLESKVTSPDCDQAQAIPNGLVDFSVFTSTPAAKRNVSYIHSKDTSTNLNIFGVDVEKADNENKDFYSNQVPLDTSAIRKELNYSLETWDNFLGKTLDAQNDIQNENLFDSFSSEPHSLLFVENGNDLVQPHEYSETKTVNDSNRVALHEENANNISNVNTTFVIDDGNEKTFVKDDSELINRNGTFTLNNTGSTESESEDMLDNTPAWGSSGGWFLHPQTSNKEPSGMIEARESTGSYVGFGIDDEIMAAIRNELLNKLPHAQVAPSEKVTEVEEWDSNEKNEVFLKYNIYNPPLSPILEESYIEESEILTPKHESDNEDSEWSEPDMPETLPPEPESQSGHTYDSQVKGPHHRHTPSQDSCCSNDTLFNLEELTCATGDVEREIDHLRNVVPEALIAEDFIESESERNDKPEDTLKEESTETDKVVNAENSLPDISNEIIKSETNNNTNGKNLNSIEDTDFNVEEMEHTDQKEDSEENCKQVNLNLGGDQEINYIEPTADTNYITEFIVQEIEHSSRQFSKEVDGSSSETNSSLEESPIAFKKVQIAPLPSPEDNPWKQLPASLLSYDKVISQNNTLLLPVTESNDTVPDFNDLPKDAKDENVMESQHENLEELNEEHVKNSVGSSDPLYENYDVTDVQPVYENIKDEKSEYEDIKTREPMYENVKDSPPVYENIKDTQPVYQNIDHPSDIYNEIDYVNIVNLENCKNNVEYVNDKKDYISTESDQTENNKIMKENGREEDIYGMLTDIKFNGPTENQLISTSFSESNDINDEQDWDSGSDTRSSSSGEFIWKEGEHEESLKALRAAPQDVLEHVKPMEGIAEESTDESDVSSSTSDEEGEVPEFVPSAWDKFATPTKSALRSPERTLEKSEKNKSKGVWFKKQKYHCVYEYPREPESPVLQSQDLWKPQLDYSSFTDWEFDADTYYPSTADDNDFFPSPYSYQPKSTSSRNLYQLTSISDFVPSNSGLEDEFFISSTARPFDVANSLSSQFFPGGANWTGENATPDSGMEDGTPGSSTDISECNTEPTGSSSVQSLKKLASQAVKRDAQMSLKNNDTIGGLRHTRNKLKLDLPPSPSAFTSTKVFTVEPTLEPVIREKPTFTTFGKSRFSVQHVDTPPEESRNRNVSFEALPYKPLKELVGLEQKEPCDSINQENEFIREKQILHDKFDSGKAHSEFIRGEASLLDSADEDSGIESSTLERKLSSDGLLQ